MKKNIIIPSICILIVAISLVIKNSYAIDNNIITSDTYEIKNNTIYAVPTSNEFLLTELKENINSTENIEVLDLDNNIVNYNEPIGTGYKLKVSDTTFNIIVLGELTNDGKISLGDISRIYNHYRGNKTIQDNTVNAGKLTNNDNITLGDVSKLYNFYKGNKPFSYYSKDYPDGLPFEANIVVDNLSALKSSNASVGQIVQTKGYSSVNDNGGAKYKIEEKGNQTIDNALYVKLSNGNIAKLLIGKKTINIKQLGAKGDGTTDDNNFFTKAINSGAETIYFPEGTYNLNNSKITLKKYTRLLGSDQNKTTLKDGTIRAQYGIIADNITFDGGAKQSVGYVGIAPDSNSSILVNVTPAENQKTEVIYKDCTFKNATVGSYAVDSVKVDEPTKRIKNNQVQNCTFKDLGRLGIYHNLTMGNGTYINNTFTDIGSDDLDSGEISAIFLGDITNNTRYEVDNIIIKDNIFNNLITKDNFATSEDQTHVINANFIAIRGYNALIDNNTISNLIGYGNDREGVYTKIQNLTVSNNTITDAGMGEGYICAKPHFGAAVANIINNKIIGKAGNAIRSYVPGSISDNTISIENSPKSIECTISETVDPVSYPLTISNNTFTSGVYTDLTYHGHTVTGYGTKNKIASAVNANTSVIFENNIVNPSTDYSSYISMINVEGKITVHKNKFYLSQRTGDSIVSISTTDKSYDKTLDSEVVFDENYFENGNFKACTRTGFGQADGVVSNRNITFKNNTINQVYPRAISAIISQVPNTNEDKLIVSGNTTNTTKENTLINTQTKYFELDNPDFAKVTHKLKS